ncbi:PAS domain-containing protein [Streptomyces sp. NBC_00147]
MLLGRLFDQLGESQAGDPVALELHARREGSHTVFAIRDAAWRSLISEVEAEAFEQSAAGLEVYDTDLLVLRSNSSALAMRGLLADRVLAHPVADLDSRLPLTQLLRRVLSGSEPAVHETVHGHDGHGGQQIFSVTAFKLQEELRTVGVGAVIHDVTGQERAQSAAHLLARAEADIGTTLDAMGTCRELASVATRTFADATSALIRSCKEPSHLRRRYPQTCHCGVPPSKQQVSCTPSTRWERRVTSSLPARTCRY